MTKSEIKIRNRLEKFTKSERSLLLYFEARAVDYGGRWYTDQTNNDDMLTMEKWRDKGWIEYGRIRFSDINSDGSMWVRIGPRLLKLAQAERRVRMDRMWKNRTYETILEKNGGTHVI